MNDEKLREEIALRLEIERRVREQLREIEAQARKSEKSRWAWLESKLTLLIIGAVLSGLLVPTFQFTQEKIKWHRQNRYDGIERQLDSIRQSLKQFIAVQGLSAEFYDLGLDVLDDRTAGADPARWEEWRKLFSTARARRVQQNAVFAATVFYFPSGSRDTIRQAWNKLLVPAQQLETVVGDLLRDRTRGADNDAREATSLNEAARALDVSFTEVNRAYERVLTVLRRQLQEVEHESTTFQ